MTTDWRQLKTLEDVAAAQANGEEIEYLRQMFDRSDGWYAWGGDKWTSGVMYRARPRQPKMKTVKMLAYLLNGQLVWYQDNAGCPEGNRFWIRVPAQDIEIEIPEVKG